jgi:hypothetical protein
MTRRRETVLDPGLLTASDLEFAARTVAQQPV